MACWAVGGDALPGRAGSGTAAASLKVYAPKDVRGPEVVRSAQQRAREIFPVVEYQVEDLVAEGDKVVARYTVRATSRGNGSSPGRPIEVTGMTLFRIAEGRIRETWIVNDQIEMFLQLGYTLEPPGKP